MAGIAAWPKAALQTKCFAAEFGPNASADFAQAAFWLSAGLRQAGFAWMLFSLAGLRRAAIRRLLLPKLIIIVNSGKLFEFNLALLLNKLGKKVKNAENVRNVRLE